MNDLHKYGLSGFTLIFLAVVAIAFFLGGLSRIDFLDTLFTVVGIALGAAWIAAIARKHSSKAHKFE